jgi:hypothetical protein
MSNRKDEERDRKREGNTHNMEYTQLTENYFWWMY